MASELDTYERSASSYGNTTLNHGASAHLGNNNVTNNVRIAGGVHLHLPEPSAYITASNQVVALLDVVDRLQKLGSKLAKSHTEKAVRRTHGRSQKVVHANSVDEGAGSGLPSQTRDANLAFTLIERLASAKTSLDDIVRTSATTWNLIQPGAEKSLYDSICAAASHAKEILELVENMTVEGQQKATNPNDEDKELLEGIRVLASSQVFQTRSRDMSIYRRLLNDQLRSLINRDSETKALLNQTLKGTLDDNENTYLNGSKDIVEVLSVNHMADTGLQSTATVLRRKDGSLTTLSPVMILEPDDIATIGDKLVRYDLSDFKAGTPEQTVSASSFVESASDYTQVILRLLYFREESTRRIEVKTAHARTFGWIFEKGIQARGCSSFRSWLETANRCFWINGKAGSGKSTLMKYIHDHRMLKVLLRSWAGKRRLVVCSFFFWHAGTDLQKSYEGVLRSLLHQLLVACPVLTAVLFPRLAHYLLLHPSTDDVDIELSELKEALLTLRDRMPESLAVCLVIDGIDEYAQDHFEFARFLLSLTDGKSIKLLASSRPISACHQIFGTFETLRLQDLTTGDIEAYVDAELLQDQLLQDMDCLEPGIAAEIKHSLTSKASGVFLWIVLVVRRLLIGLGNYEDRSMLIAAIDELPNDLEDLYDFMFGKMNKSNQIEGSRYLQLISTAQAVQHTHLTATQMFVVDKHFAGTHMLSLKTNRTDKEEELWIKNVEGRLRNRCCGLIEVQYPAATGPLHAPRVDYLHRTVHDYIHESAVQNKLREICDPGPVTLLTALLASAVYQLLLKQGYSLSHFSAAARSESWEALFADCASYCRHLSASGDSEYLQLYRVANTAFLDWASRQDNTLGSYYANVYALLKNQKRPQSPLDTYTSGIGASTVSCVLPVLLGMPDYLREELNTVTLPQEHYTLLLLWALESIYYRKKDSPFDASMLENISIMLRFGADPNGRFTSVEAPVWFAQWQKSTSNIAAMKDPRSHPESPWEFCLSRTPAEHRTFLSALLSLAGAKADLTPAKAWLKAASERHEHLLQRVANNPGTDTRTRLVAEKLLERMQSAPQTMSQPVAERGKKRTRLLKFFGGAG